LIWLKRVLAREVKEMMKLRMIVIGIIAGIFLTTSVSFAVTAVKNSGVSPVPSSGNKSGAGSASSPAKIFKTTVIVTKLESSTLYAANGQKYDLHGAKVNNYIASRKNKTDKNTIAELTYVNDVLKEVTIR
jgi:hypothetical protein